MNIQGATVSGGLNGRVLNALIDFNFVFNTDVGLIRFIQENYRNNKAFCVDILNKSDGEILSLLCNRTNRNPLSVISTQENMKNIDDLYNQFFKKYKIQIVSKAVIFPAIGRFMKLIESYGRSFGISASFAVSDSIEEGAFRSRFSGFNFLPYTNKSIRTRDPFYVKDLDFFLKNGFEDIIHKKIYLFPFQYSIEYLNLEQNDLTMKNEFSFIGDQIQYVLRERMYDEQ